MKTIALRLYGKKDLRLDTFELPPAGEGELLVRIVSDSICMSSYKAAEQGGGEGKGACAKNMLGYIYLCGHGVDKDEVKALSLFMEAAEDGCSHAPDSVGECYENGYGAERNLTEALKWYQKGAAIGDDTAAENFERLKNLID